MDENYEDEADSCEALGGGWGVDSTSPGAGAIGAAMGAEGGLRSWSSELGCITSDGMSSACTAAAAFANVELSIGAKTTIFAIGSFRWIAATHAASPAFRTQP